MAKAPRPAAPSRHAWDPVDLTAGEISSIKAIASQHSVGFTAIVEKLCRFHDMSFAAGGDDGRRETDYAEGKRSVAHNLLQIVTMKMPTTRPSDSGPHAVPKGAPPSD